jgi:hypothetical protein
MIEFFHKIINVLEECKIEYMLSGSVAMSIYVNPRMTRDFDFIIQLNTNDIEIFVDKFKDGYYCESSSIQDAIKHQTMFNIIDYASGYKADFVILKKNHFRETEFTRKSEMRIFDRNVFVVSKEDLLISKIIWIQQLQSGIQMEDIKNLNEIESLDRDYLKHWILLLNLNTFNLL